MTLSYLRYSNMEQAATVYPQHIPSNVFRTDSFKQVKDALILEKYTLIFKDEVECLVRVFLP